MKIEAIYNTSYNNGSVEVVSGYTQIYEDWLSEEEIRDLAIQFKDAYLEFSKNKLLHLIEEALDDAENLESLESEEYSAIIVRLKQAIKLLSE